jgi:hypothetical protein
MASAGARVQSGEPYHIRDTVHPEMYQEEITDLTAQSAFGPLDGA